MEFAAVNSPKAVSKTVAITLTNEEANNPASAFAALLNLGKASFKAEHGLNKAEGQWMRAPKQNDADAAAKPKDDLAAKPKEKISADDDATDDDTDQVVASAASDKPEETAPKQEAAAAPASETKPVDQAAAIAAEAVQGISIQFQVFVQQPDGSLQDMGTYDLKALLAAASQDAGLASALEAAFTQAADSLGIDQTAISSLAQSAAGDVTQKLAVDTSLAANAAQANVETNNNADTNGVSKLFKQIASAFHPLAHKAEAATTNTQATQTAQAAAATTSETAQASADLLSPEVVRQSQELSKILGQDSKVRIQVAVNGQKVADLPFDNSPFNRFVGYNPEVTRAAALAQSNQSSAPSALPDSAPTTLISNATQQASFVAQQAPGGALQRPEVRAEVAAVRAPDSATPNTTTSTSSGSSNQASTFATALGQTQGNTATAQTSAPERPAPTQPQQVIDQIKVNITRAAKAGLDRVTIMLRPEELGRIDIKLEMTQDGEVRANITADKPATLELLQREVRGLERALQDAGLQTDTDNLEFNLRSDNQDRLAENNEKQGHRAHNTRDVGTALKADNENEESFDYAAAARKRGGVDTYV